MAEKKNRILYGPASVTGCDYCPGKDFNEPIDEIHVVSVEITNDNDLVIVLNNGKTFINRIKSESSESSEPYIWRSDVGTIRLLDVEAA